MTNEAIETQLPALSSEFQDATFGDIRLTERLKVIVDAAAERPDVGFPRQAESDAALEATYRFLGNERVRPDEVLRPHITCTIRRAAEAGLVLAVHDTTEFEFDDECWDDLGWLSPSRRGFLGHFALAVSADGLRRPLGLLGMSTVFRSEPAPQADKRKPKGNPNELNGEHKRWGDLAFEVGERLSQHAELIHVMDREADAYPLFCTLVGANQRFIIRANHDRSIACDDSPAGKSRLSSALSEVTGVIERQVKLSKRKARPQPKANKKHPPREERLARLYFSATAVSFVRPYHAKALPAELSLNVVRVWEPKPPEGEPPIEWRLVTTEPVETPEQVMQVVDCYRARWVIEEFFKSLKTGCAYTKRQLESRHAMLNALAVLAPVAWRLLLLRTLARTAPGVPASEVFTPTQIDILKAVNKRLKLKVKLSRQPTAHQAMMVVAELGGYIKYSSTPPGWIILGRGLHDLMLIELGWSAREDHGKM